MFDLTGKTALVTGATGAIGGAIARALHAQGAMVALSGTRREVLDVLAGPLPLVGVGDRGTGGGGEQPHHALVERVEGRRGVAVDVERSHVRGVVVVHGRQHDGHGQVGADTVLVGGGLELRPRVLVLTDDRADGVEGAGGLQAGAAVGAVLLLVDLDERVVAGRGGSRLRGADRDGDGVGVLDRSGRGFGEPLQDLVEGFLGGEPVAQHRERGGRLVQALHRVLPVRVGGRCVSPPGHPVEVVHVASPFAENEFAALDSQRAHREWYGQATFDGCAPPGD